MTWLEVAALPLRWLCLGDTGRSLTAGPAGSWAALVGGVTAAATGGGSTTTSATVEPAAKALEVRTKTGVHKLSAALIPGPTDDPQLQPPASRHPERFAPFHVAAMFLRVAAPESSCKKMQGAMRRFRAALNWWGIELAAVTAITVMAFVALRCAPPVNVDLPAVLNTLVLPVTAIGDVDALRRAAKLGVGGLGGLLRALDHPAVHQLGRAIGARIPRIRTTKKPLLWVEIEKFVREALATKLQTRIRDACAVVLGFVFGLRASEITSLLESDLQWVKSVAGQDAIQLTLRTTKTRRSVFATHQAFTRTSAHPLLLEAFAALDDAGYHFAQGGPLFFRTTGSTREALGRDWLSKLVASVAKDVTPHSLRVGMATELRAAGASLEEIMAAGRWSSTAALLYVLSSIDNEILIYNRLGGGNLRWSVDGNLSAGADLRPDPDAVRDWAERAAQTPEEIDDDDDGDRD